MFETFRKKCKQERDCQLNWEARFITEGSSATQVHVLRTNEDKNAGLVITDQEGPDKAIVFTLIEADREKNLRKGDYYL